MSLVIYGLLAILSFIFVPLMSYGSDGEAYNPLLLARGKADEMCGQPDAFKFKNMYSGLMLSAEWKSRMKAGGSVVQYKDKNQPYIEWIPVLIGNSLFKFQNRNSRLLLAVWGASKENGANVIQWYDDNPNYMKWKLIPTQKGPQYFQFQNQNSGLLLAGWGSDKKSGANVIQWQDYGQSGAIWQAIPIYYKPDCK